MGAATGQRRTDARQGPGRLAPPRRPSRTDEAALLHALEAHIATLKGENETLKAQLASAESRLGAGAAALEAERARTEKAISAFSSLAERLDPLAAERAKPWWRRLASG
jgi:hypothetical protein